MPLGGLLAPFTKHKNLGLRETFVGIGKMCLPVYSPIGHFKGLSELHIGPLDGLEGRGKAGGQAFLPPCYLLSCISVP